LLSNLDKKSTADNRRLELFGSAQTVITDNSLHYPEELMTAKNMGKIQEGGKAFAFRRRGRTKAIPVMYSSDDSSTAQNDSLEAAWKAVRTATNRQPEKSPKQNQSKR
jgi:hypothetical protein